jgi:hypothetical protein
VGSIKRTKERIPSSAFKNQSTTRIVSDTGILSIYEIGPDWHAPF